MTIFSPQKFHQKAKNPRKRPILSKFVVPKVPAVFDSEHDENLGLTYPKEKKLKITNYPRFAFT